MKCRKKTSIFAILIIIFLIPTARTQPTSGEKTFTMALTGDAIITRKLSVYNEPQFLKMIDLIRFSDMAFTNLEMLFHDYEPYPMHESGGTYMRAEPSLVNELVWAGFDMVARANNHTGDYGVLGMDLTTEYTEKAGLVQAGVGKSLPEAREAKFLETAKGRVALISCASTFPDHCLAGKSRGDIPARPGLNPLRYSTSYYAPKEYLQKIQGILAELDMNPPELRNSLRILGRRYLVGDKLETRSEPNREDIEEIGAVVKNAGLLADYVIVTFHSHESGKTRSEPAEFLTIFAKKMIDAGADLLVGHGPHVLRGIEIYKGKPIFYSLGDFMFQNETLLRLPYENYQRYNLDANNHVGDFNIARYNNDKRGFPVNPKIWESVIAVPHWQGKKLVDIKLYPITLGFGKPRTVRGRPMFAGPELSAKIIEDLKLASKPFGTAIDFVDGIGVVRLASN